jgi:hypothetical protein
LVNKNYEEICIDIAKISPYIRFVAVIGKDGNVLSHYRRDNLQPLLDAKNTKYQFTHIAIKTDLEAFFDESLGEVEFVWEERQKVQIMSFAIKRDRVWISIDKKVVRTEVLRIIDACLPIVKKHTIN